MTDKSILLFCPPSRPTKMLRHHRHNRKSRSLRLTMHGSFVIWFSRMRNCTTLLTEMTTWLLIRVDEVTLSPNCKGLIILIQELGSPPPRRHGTSHPYSYSYRRLASPGTPVQSQSVSSYAAESHARSTFVARSPGQAIHYPNNYIPSPHHATELDGHYWKNMFVQLGFGENSDMSMSMFATTPAMPSFMDQSDNQPHSSRHSSESQGPVHYHSLRSPSSPQPFGH